MLAIQFPAHCHINSHTKEPDKAVLFMEQFLFNQKKGKILDGHGTKSQSQLLLVLVVFG